MQTRIVFRRHVAAAGAMIAASCRRSTPPKGRSVNAVTKKEPSPPASLAEKKKRVRCNVDGTLSPPLVSPLPV
ncbi:hypothetical protein L1987_23825 [Smallanthus sonchifolius]|uniref:Uncharacterized protein n=1 Tax=Smallanthus sonchifolius TaxID=185202 RepID=A0ACB9IIY7_9ASTR|nr:hypothetical protein L1987_23825 [Smallanthus sonchifolius]